ncbi:hypothetical protein Ahia01_001389600 [Argonauta hians]
MLHLLYPLLHKHIQSNTSDPLLAMSSPCEAMWQSGYQHSSRHHHRRTAKAAMFKTEKRWEPSPRHERDALNVDKLRSALQQVIENENRGGCDRTMNYSKRYVDYTAARRSVDHPKRSRGDSRKHKYYPIKSSESLSPYCSSQQQQLQQQQQAQTYVAPSQYCQKTYPDRHVYNDRRSTAKRRTYPNGQRCYDREINTAKHRNNTESLISWHGVKSVVNLDSIGSLSGPTDYSKHYTEYTDGSDGALPEPVGAAATLGKTRTFGFGDSLIVQETPVMFSRCCSLDSLNRSDTIHSPSVSNYGRQRATKVVSHWETFPRSPIRKIPTEICSDVQGSEDLEDMNDFSEEAPEEDAATTSGIEPGSRILSDLFEGELTLDMCKLDSIYKTQCMLSDCSETSLNASTFSDDKREVGGNVPHMEAAIVEEKDDKENSSMSEISEGEEDILARCISSAMPNNSNKKFQRNTCLGNSLKTKNDAGKTDYKTNSRIKLATKAVSNGAAHANHSLLPLQRCVRSVPVSKHPENLYIDAVKYSVTKGNSLNFSPTTPSFSDLSRLLPESSPSLKPSGCGERSEAEGESDNTSVGKDNDKLISQNIQSTKPKGKVTRLMELLKVLKAKKCSLSRFHV